MNFNPRSHKGSDDVLQLSFGNANISIHAPTRGATGSASLQGAQFTVFQSTLPQGERLYDAKNGLVEKDFNPRSHKGSDLDARLSLIVKQEFQSTLPQGERLHSLQFIPH